MHPRRLTILVWPLLLAGLVSGSSRADPRTPAAIPGQPAPFLGTAVLGSGGLTAAVDAYGDIVELRSPGPAGTPLVSVPFRRQLAGSVAATSVLSADIEVGRSGSKPLWQGRDQTQRYRRGSNVLVTSARFGAAKVELTDAVDPRRAVFARRIVTSSPAGLPVRVRLRLGDVARHCAERSLSNGLEILCSFHGSSRGTTTGDVIHRALAADRRWLSRARPLGKGAPAWTRAAYERSLLVLRALTDRQTGAQIAGPRNFWAYVWPRDAATGAIALAASGYADEARRVARFLLGLDPSAGARFQADGSLVDDGRPAPGDSAAWIEAAARATGLRADKRPRPPWRGRQDYRERDGESADYLGNAVASQLSDAALTRGFGSPRGLSRHGGDPTSGLDSAAAWAVIPFERAALRPAIARTLASLASNATLYGIRPAERWPGPNPWTAATAWSAAALARLDDRKAADRLLEALRRAATPAGLLPERTGLTSGLPLSTTPLAWSHAWQILALRARWP
ncbi:MAG: glucoamylase [Solirubrobacterales bacterium]|nr:glucoamylase [Solirubrobacterales bacterium]